MKKRILSLALAGALGLSTFFSPGASAESLSELKQKQQNIMMERAGIKADIKEKESKINELKTEQEVIAEEIKRLDFAVEDAINKIEEKNAEIKQTEAEIAQLKKEIANLKERIEKRNELLKERAVAFQENGGSVSYLDVLFGAESFGDFIDRVGAVATIVQADKNILEEHQADMIALEEKQAEVESKLAKLKKMKAELEELKAELDRQVAEKNQLMESLKKEEEHMHAEKLAAQEEEAVLAAQEAAIQKAIQLEQARQAAARKRSKQSTMSSNSAVSDAPPISDGTFTWPAAGRLSSGFGSRSLGNHYGIDIAKAGTVPIVAAADGVVIRSYYSPSYGNAIFVSHSIDGQVYTTVYAHLSTRSVSSGDVVTKGQQIGLMGNTGHSFGQHLHFELHKGPWNGAKSNAVNPLSYLP